MALVLESYSLPFANEKVLHASINRNNVYSAMQEMIGVSMFMARGTMTDVLGAFKEAFYRHNSAAPHEAQPRECVRYATRAMLLAAEYARQHGAYNDANYALMKAHFQVCFRKTCGPMRYVVLFACVPSAPVAWQSVVT